MIKIETILNFMVIYAINFLLPSIPIKASWEEWWTYEGISGPDFWGRLNPKWSLCTKGRRQSPINIEPELLLFDPFLPALDIIGHVVNGQLINNGHGITFKVIENPKLDKSEQLLSSVSLVNGPLIYTYTLSHLTFHYGKDNSKGSEHTINGTQFPGEIQFYAYNSHLYSSFEEASSRANGILAVSVLLQISNNLKQLNSQLKRITQALNNITKIGSSQKIDSLSIVELLSSSLRRQYLTYDGSLTQPACHETVQWIILNKPIYITSNFFNALKMSFSNNQSQSEDNYRPVQKLNLRPIRTNINFETIKKNDTETSNIDRLTKESKQTCTMKRPVIYRANLKTNSLLLDN